MKAYQNFTSVGGWTSGTRSSNLRRVVGVHGEAPVIPPTLKRVTAIQVPTIWTMVDGALYWSEFHDGPTSAARVRRYFSGWSSRIVRPHPTSRSSRGRRISGNAREMSRGDEEAAHPPRRRSVLPSPPSTSTRAVVRLSLSSVGAAVRREDWYPLQMASKPIVSATSGRTKDGKTYLETMQSAKVRRCRVRHTRPTSSRAPTSLPYRRRVATSNRMTSYT